MPVTAQPAQKPFRDLAEQLDRFGATLERVGEEVFLPAFARNYDGSGLKKRSGVLKDAVSKRGAMGNVFHIAGNSIEVGVDTVAVPYAKFAIGGRGPVVAKPGKVLRFEIDGKVFFRKRVGPAPPRPVIYLRPDDLEKAQEIVSRELGKDWAMRLR